jgi:hypothetical protein
MKVNHHCKGNKIQPTLAEAAKGGGARPTNELIKFSYLVMEGLALYNNLTA